METAITEQRVKEMKNEVLLTAYALLFDRIADADLKGKQRKEIVKEKDLIRNEILRRMGN